MDIEAAFELELSVLQSGEESKDMRLQVSKLASRLECKLARNENDGGTIHVRQTGHVALESDFLKLDSTNNTDEKTVEIVKKIVQDSIINALKNVDDDLPPLSDICENAWVSLNVYKC